MKSFKQKYVGDFEFSIDFESADGKIETKEFKLVKPSGKICEEFRDERQNCTQYNAEGNVCGFKGLNALPVKLLSRCVHDDQNNLVPATVLREWDADIVDELYTKARDMGKLNLEESEEAIQKQIDKLQEILKQMKQGEDEVKN